MAIVLYHQVQKTMETTKTIAIIGATEKPGADLARRLASAGNYRLLLISTNESGLDSLKSELVTESHKEIETMTCARDASWEADIIIVASTEEEREVAEKIREVAVGKIVVQFSKLSDGMRNRAVALQKLLQDSRVVCVCPAGLESDFGSTAEAFIAGNNGNAVETVSSMLKSAGLKATVTGDLAESGALRPSEFLNSRRIDLGQVLSYWRSMTRAFR